MKKDVLRNFSKSAEKKLWQSLFFNNVSGLRQQLYQKRDSGAAVFLRIFWNFWEHLFPENTSGGCSEPWLTVLTFRTSRYVQFLRLCLFWCLSMNISFMIVGEIPWCILYISIARALRLLSWTEIDCLFPITAQKRLFCHYILNKDIFHEVYLFCWFLCNHDTSKLTGNN